MYKRNCSLRFGVEPDEAILQSCKIRFIKSVFAVFRNRILTCRVSSMLLGWTWSKELMQPDAAPRTSLWFWWNCLCINDPFHWFVLDFVLGGNSGVRPSTVDSVSLRMLLKEISIIVCVMSKAPSWSWRFDLIAFVANCGIELVCVCVCLAV